DLDAILDRLVDGALRAVPAAEAGAFEQLDGEDLEYRAARGSLDGRQGTRVPLAGSVAGHCARTGEPVLVDDMLADPRADRGVVIRLNVRAALFAPVSRGPQMLGVLKLQSSRPGAFRPRDLQLMRLFAGAATAGLTEAREVAAQRAVQVGEARYRAVFDSAIDYAIVVLDLDGRVTDWNSGAERILGWGAEEMRGRPADVFFTPEDRADGVPDREMEAALATGRGADERWHLRKDGERFWANGEMMALRDGSGAAIGFVKILRDRTEQRLDLERLQGSERHLTLERGLLQAILQKAPIGISIASADGGATFNDRLRVMLGHGPVVGEARYRSYHAEHADGRPYAVMDYPTMRALQGGEVVEAELMRYRHAETRELRRWHATSTPIHGADGAIVAAVSVFSDVEDQLRASEALRASEERLSLALSASGLIGWFDWDVVADRIHSGPSFARMYGVDPAAAAAGAPIAAFLGGIHPDDRERIGDEIGRALSEGGTYNAEYRLAATDGTVTFVHALGRVARDETGRPLRFSGIVSDVTAARAAGRRQQALIDLGDALREAASVPAITRAAAGIVGRTLEVARAGFGLLDEGLDHVEIEPDWTAEGVGSIAGRHRLDDYGNLRATLLAGEPLVIEDVRTDPRTAADPRPLLDAGILAQVNVPVRERGRVTSIFIVHDAKPRRWSADDLAFLRTVADRVEVGVARVRAEEQQQLLNAEIGHRLKNTLALVQAIVTQTLRNAADVGEARQALTARLMALAKAHDVLTAGVCDRTTLRRVVEGALQLHDDAEVNRFEVAGPEVPVASRVALPLTLMVHELATNAAKY
ncbi:MAG: PAS domain S-box protein, partial [Caulobacteraceae bacterium]|nr:PAS domain S-box protein [Caulobacter sp.]